MEGNGKVFAVTKYISKNILQSSLYDKASPEQKLKAVNQACNMLIMYLPDIYVGIDSLPIAEVVEQVLWLFKMDDMMQRAEMGAMMITVDGIQVQLRDMDRTISPKILSLYGLTGVRKRKVGSYTNHVQDSFRVGQQLTPTKGGRY